MQWIDTSAEEIEHNASRGTIVHPPPVLGVNFRSECRRYRVTIADQRGESWLLWDMTAQPIVLMRGFKSNTVAMRAGEAVAASRVLRVSLRLAAIGRAVAASMRRLTA